MTSVPTFYFIGVNTYMLDTHSNLVNLILHKYKSRFASLLVLVDGDFDFDFVVEEKSVVVVVLEKKHFCDYSSSFQVMKQNYYYASPSKELYT